MRSLSIQALLLFLTCTSAEIAHVSVSGTSERAAMKSTDMIGLPELPYDYAALEPYIDERTVRIHHDKHHAKYVATTKDLIKGTLFEKVDADIVSVLRHAAREGQAGLFNNAAQSYNHALYWECMSPPAVAAEGAARQPRVPSDPRLVALINQAFGSFAQFRAKFAEAGATQFGSGWVWLVLNEQGQLEVRWTGCRDTVVTLCYCDLALLNVIILFLSPCAILHCTAHAIGVEDQQRRHAHC
jgi:superoxide dismutase, Fe-Mn family